MQRTKKHTYQNGKKEHSDHELAVMIGVEANHLLQAVRRGPVLRISLGSPPGLPVTLEMQWYLLLTALQTL